MNFIYTGLFLKENISNYASLEKVIEHPHITLDFKPKNSFQNLFGTTAKIKVIGYANNGKNEGWECQIFTDNTFLLEQYKRVKVPHITISVSKDGKPVDTAKLNFQKLDKPFILNAVFGGFYNGKIITEKA